MACCGKNRRIQPSAPNHTPTVSYTPPMPTFQNFVYVGNTALTALGAVTGYRYRFAGAGSVVAVDMRDAPSMAGVPNVRRTQSAD